MKILFNCFHFVLLYFIGEVTLVALAPLTNIAMAVRLEPDLGKTLKECFILGGNTEGRINE